MVTGYNSSSAKSNFNLGLFLNFKLNHGFSVQFDALAKYKMGAKELPFYSLGDHLLDSLFRNGHLERNLSYLALVPTIQYRFWSNCNAELGPHIALRTKAIDLLSEGDLKYEKNVKEFTTLFDFGVATGLSYQFNKGTGVKLSIRYYAGVTDMFKDEDRMNASRSLQLNAYIPVGREKAKKKD